MESGVNPREGAPMESNVHPREGAPIETAYSHGEAGDRWAHATR
jgi:hypothetical protein